MTPIVLPLESSAQVRERPPLRLAIDIVAPDGRQARWATDEPHPANVPRDLTFSTTMPGGFEQLACTLARRPKLNYPDLAEFATVTARGIGGRVAWQGRLELTPRTSGSDSNVAPGAVGWQAHLDDNQSIIWPYLDTQLGSWQPENATSRIADLASGWALFDPTTRADPDSGEPVLATAVTGAWTGKAQCIAEYDGHGAPLGTLFYAWKAAGVSSTDTNWSWFAGLLDDVIAWSGDYTTNLRAAGPGTGTLSAVAATRKKAAVLLKYAVGGGAAGVEYGVAWTYLAAAGYGGPAPVGTLGAAGGIGVLASDAIAHAIRKWAPKLAVSRAGIGTIQTTGFPIPQLAFLTPTTCTAIIKEAVKYEYLDWWVDEGPTFNLATPGTYGRRWQARVGPSGLQETGPQVDKIFNGVIVSYSDVTGVTRTAGPVGSGADTEDASLSDPDSANPATVAGLRRWAVLNMNVTSVASAAIRVGQAFLFEQRLISTAGQSTHRGWIQDDHGVLWPVWMMRAGDQIAFIDAHDPSYRRIVKTSYSDTGKENQISLDSPPDGLQELLERLGAALVGVI